MRDSHYIQQILEINERINDLMELEDEMEANEEWDEEGVVGAVDLTTCGSRIPATNISREFTNPTSTTWGRYDVGWRQNLQLLEDSSDRNNSYDQLERDVQLLDINGNVANILDTKKPAENLSSCTNYLNDTDENLKLAVDNNLNAVHNGLNAVDNDLDAVNNDLDAVD